MPTTESSTSSALLTGVRSRRPDAWARFARLYTPIVYSWGRQAGLQENDLADVVQEVFQTALVNIDHFDSGRGPLRNWLWGITRNKLRHHVRERGAEFRAIGGTDANAALQQLPDSPFEETTGRIDPAAGLMHQAISLIRPELQEATWQAFWRTVVEGEKTADVARDLGMTTQAVRQARYRVLRRLRDELDGQIPT